MLASSRTRVVLTASALAAASCGAEPTRDPVSIPIAAVSGTAPPLVPAAPSASAAATGRVMGLDVTLRERDGGDLYVYAAMRAQFRECLPQVTHAGTWRALIEIDAYGDLRGFSPLEQEEPALDAVACFLQVIQRTANAGAWQPYAPRWIVVRVRVH